MVNNTKRLYSSKATFESGHFSHLTPLNDISRFPGMYSDNSIWAVDLNWTWIKARGKASSFPCDNTFLMQWYHTNLPGGFNVSLYSRHTCQNCAGSWPQLPEWRFSGLLWVRMAHLHCPLADRMVLMFCPCILPPNLHKLQTLTCTGFNTCFKWIRFS